MESIDNIYLIIGALVLTVIFFFIKHEIRQLPERISRVLNELKYHANTIAMISLLIIIIYIYLSFIL